MKRIISLILIILIISSTCAFAFNDTYGHWASGYADKLFELGILTGDENGNANLTSTVKRIEFIAMITRAMYRDEKMPSGSASFGDVKKGDWYFDLASFAKNKGIIGGDENGNLLPSSEIKREEIVLIIYRALALSGGECSFEDIEKNYPYYNEVSAVVGEEIIKGYDDGTFKPKALATRGEAAAIICRMLKLEVKEPSVQKEPINLTWHQIYNNDVKVTGNHMNGLNVISPTWFRIVDNTGKTPYSYEKELGGGLNLYLQDLGNLDYIKDAKAEGYKVWVLFKTDFNSKTTSAFLNSDEARWSAINQIRDLIKKYNLDGINMDFENMYVKDKDIYTWFVKEMTDMCHQMGIPLSVDVTKYDADGGTWSLCYDRTAIASYADYVALMAYDQNGTWSTKGGSVASLPWVEEAIKITLKEVPAEKLLLGIPFYTRLWEEKGGKVVKTSAIGMKTAQDKINQAGAAITYDSKTGQNYAEWKSGESTFKIWLEDETSVKARLDLMKKYNLAGVASWSKTFETANIWDVINKNLFTN